LFNKVKKFVKSKFSKSMLAVSAIAMAAMPTVGAAGIDFSTNTATLPDVKDVVSTGFSFMGMFDTYTMLVLGIIFAPVAIGFILWLWRKLPKMGSSKA